MQTLLKKASFALLLALSLDIGLDDGLDLEIAGNRRMLAGGSRGYSRIPHAGLWPVSSTHSESSESCDPGTDRDIPSGWLNSGGWAQPDRSERLDFCPRPIPSEFLAGISPTRGPPSLHLA